MTGHVLWAGDAAGSGAREGGQEGRSKWGGGGGEGAAGRRGELINAAGNLPRPVVYGGAGGPTAACFHGNTNVSAVM